MIIKNGKRMDGTYDNIPVGTISAFTGTTAPIGYLLCQGQKVSKTTYKELYDICKNHFGPETSTEFTLPDLRGKTLAGCDLTDGAMNSIGKLIGAKKHLHTTGNHTLTINEMPSHDHQLAFYGDISGGGGGGKGVPYNAIDNNKIGTDSSGCGNTGGSQPHNHGNTGESSNFQPTVVINWIVKAYMVVPSPSVVENALDSMNTDNALSAYQGKVLKDKIKDIEPHLLYEYKPAEDNFEVILNDNASNYNFLEVEFEYKLGSLHEIMGNVQQITRKGVRLLPANGKCDIQLLTSEGDWIYFLSNNLEVFDNKIESYVSYITAITNQSGVSISSKNLQSDEFTILKVMGYK